MVPSGKGASSGRLDKQPFKGSHLFVTCAFWRPKDDLVVSVVGYGDGTLKNSERKFLFNAQSGKAVPAH